MRNTLIIIFAAILIMGCEREVNISPRDTSSTLVVDATIETGQTPLIFLSKSYGYFTTLSKADVSDASVKGASVSITANGKNYPMKEFSLLLNGISISYYAPDPSNPGSLIVGKENTSYQLNIVNAGQTYTATTTIPAYAKTMDSLWWEKAPNNKDTNRVVAFMKITDPPGLGNYMRYYTSRNDSGFIPGRNSVFDDAIVDGTTFNINVPRGQSRNDEIIGEEYGYFKRGDTIAAKVSNIDKASFDFWRTWEASQDNNGNPFGTPVKVIGNISNGALGCFGGYASRIKTIIVPK